MQFLQRAYPTPRGEERMATATSTRPIERSGAGSDEVPDPEIPAVSVIDLGIVRDVRWRAGTNSSSRSRRPIRVAPRPASSRSRSRTPCARRGSTDCASSAGSRRPGPPTGSSKGQASGCGLRHRAAGRAGGADCALRPLARPAVSIDCPRCGRPTPRGSASSARRPARRSTAAERASSPSTTSSASDTSGVP